MGEVVSLVGAGVGIGDCLLSHLGEVLGVGSGDVSGVGSAVGVGDGGEIQEHRQFSRGFLFGGNSVNCGGACKLIESRGVIIGVNEGEAVGVGIIVGVGEGGGVMGLGRSTTIFLNFFLPDRFVRYVGYLLSFFVANWQLLRLPNNTSWHGISFRLSSMTFPRFFTKGKVS